MRAFCLAFNLPEPRQRIVDDTQTALGATQLPAVLAAIVNDTLRGLRVPDVSHLPALYETLRVGANLCVDHGATNLSSIPKRVVLTLYRQKQGPTSRVKVPDCSHYLTRTLQLSHSL